MLDQNIDEAGAAFESQGKQIALSINQGDSRFNSLCQKNRPLSDLSRSFYQDACHGHAIVYADEISNRKFRPYITYPQGNFASPVFHGERPDPMPHYEMTGNPVSIAFSEQSPPVKMRSFKLYQDTKEIRDVKILDKDNDPNRL
ncbi:CAP domain-containing protein, partial [Neisseria sp. P0022.S002]